MSTIRIFRCTCVAALWFGAFFVQMSFAQTESAMPAQQVQSLAPVIHTFTPFAISPGAAAFTLAINGYGFQQSARVTMSAVPLEVLRVDSMFIAVRVPAALVARAGLPVVIVHNPDGQQVGARFGVIPDPVPLPRIIRSPYICYDLNTKPIPLTIKGQYLHYVTSAKLDTTVIPIVNAVDTALTVIIPAKVLPYPWPFANPAILTLTNRDGFSTKVPVSGIFCDPAPSIDSIIPATNTQLAGTSFSLVVHGGFFLGGARVVLVSEKKDTLSSTVISDEEIRCVVPATLSSGQYELRMVNPDGMFAARMYGLLTEAGAVDVKVGNGIRSSPRVSTATLPSITLSPHPVTDVLSVATFVTTSCRLTVRVFDVLQNEAAPSVTEQVSSGQWSMRLNLSALPRGVYILELSSNDGHFPPQKRQILKQ
jgi:hypothetical protein